MATICLLVLTACSGLRQFPTKYIYEFDPKSRVCGVYEVVNFESMHYVHIKDLSLEECPAIFGFKDRDIPEVLQWAREAQAYARSHCK